jgi:hypothetical protein
VMMSACTVSRRCTGVGGGEELDRSGQVGTGARLDGGSDGSDVSFSVGF